MNEVLKSLETRRSIRSYQTEQIKEEELQQVLRAGTYAATGMGRQSPVMVVVQDPATRNKISALNAAVMNSKGDPFYGAPTVIVVLANADIPTYREDGSMVMGNLLNAAHAVGLGSCWIHRAKEVFESPEGKELLKQWGLEGNYVGVGNCILGYIKGDVPDAKPRKEQYIIRV